MSKKNVSRRDFLKGMAVAGAMAAATGTLASCSPAAEAPATLPKKWDEEADIVVVGYGVAGARAAMEAHDAGAKVIILEKASAAGMCTTAMSGGMFNLGGGTALQKDLGVEETPDEFYAFLKAQGGDQAQDDLQRVHAEHAVETFEFLEKTLGLEFPRVLAPIMTGDSVPVSPDGHMAGLGWLGNETFLRDIGVYPNPKPHAHFQGGAGKGFFAALQKQVEQRGIPVFLSTPAQRLVATTDKVVVGVQAEREGTTIHVKAKKAVILASGGYGHNKSLIKGCPMNYLDIVRVCPTNTGDGIIMAQALGAEFFVCDGGNFIGQGYNEGPLGQSGPAPLPLAIGKAPQANVLWVERRGRRFCNEDWHFSAKAIAWSKTGVYPNEYIAFCIFDEATRAAYKVNLEEKCPTIKMANGMTVEFKTLSANTIEELAEKAKEIDPLHRGIDPAGLRQTIDTWNENVKNGRGDPEWGRVTSLTPIETPPYYVTIVWPVMVNESSGLRIDAGAHILDVFGQPIPRLYGAGRVTGGQYGQFYTCGTALATGLIMGKIAAKNAVAEKPWEA
jgi:succinate dehydrogenase/fumarate reductase flavoprotein subunit